MAADPAEQRTPGEIRMTKHHGAGNDFLVLLDPAGSFEVSTEQVRWMCDRHRGIGADGFIRVRTGRMVPLGMELWNADGSAAEMSGNGIRCMVQAAVDGGMATEGEVGVETGAGTKSVIYAKRGPLSGEAIVDMGPVVSGDELAARSPLWPSDHSGMTLPEESAFVAARFVDAGNPHLVVILEHRPDGEVMLNQGAALQMVMAGGINVEFVWPGPADGELSLFVFERGAGPTLACGTGSCAAALVARDLGMAGDVVPVHNPGGCLSVSFLGTSVNLSGPTLRIAEVLLDAKAFEIWALAVDP